MLFPRGLRLRALAMLGALFCAVGLHGSLAQEKVTFDSTEGGVPTKVAGYLYKPEGAGPFPAIVSMHGCSGLLDEDKKVQPLYGHWGEDLAPAGYMVLLPDSHGSRGYGNLCPIQPPTSWPVLPSREGVMDAYGAMNYLRSRADVRPDAIVILGQSAGARAMFHTVDVSRTPAGLEPAKDFRLALALYPPCAPFEAQQPKWAPRQPLLLLMGEADDFTPAAPCRAMVARLVADGKSVEAHFYPGLVYHAYDHPNSEVRVLTNVKLADGHSPHVGTNPEARLDTIARVKKFLKDKLN